MTTTESERMTTAQTADTAHTAETARWTKVLADDADLSRAFIDGRYVDAAGGETLPCISPITGEVVASVAAGSTQDVDRAVAAARRAFEDGRWSDRSPRERKKVLLRFAELIEAHTEELAALMTIDVGKPISSARGEVAGSVSHVQWMAEAADHLYGQVAPLGPDVLATITYEPVGVVGAIVPWNYPLLMPIWKIAPALASGNTIVVKPAEQSPLVSIALGRIAAEAGIPDGVLNVVPGRGEIAGRALAEHMDVDAIGFTGSTEVGRLIMRYAAESNLKKVALELGGKSPNIVLADAENLDVVAAHSAAGIFANTGQVCDAASRLIVDAAVADDVVAGIVAATANWTPGNPFDPNTTMGSMVDQAQMERVLGYVDIGRAEGAEIAAGGNRTREETGGFYVEPTVLRTDASMRVAREEIFGPVLSVIPVQDEAEALRIAHDTSYGLAAAVWTKDINKALRIARTLRAGSVWVNGWDLGDVTIPHGGYKQSGLGRDKSLLAFDNYTQPKTTGIAIR
jgi:acyl-CoA reductase-like NAD-dependent aldehyde dehydrogenase